MKIHTITYILLIVGGLNWLLEAFNYGIGNYINSGLATVIYVLVGLSAIYEALNHKKLCKNCEPKNAGM